MFDLRDKRRCFDSFVVKPDVSNVENFYKIKLYTGTADNVLGKIMGRK